MLENYQKSFSLFVTTIDEMKIRGEFERAKEASIVAKAFTNSHIFMLEPKIIEKLLMTDNKIYFRNLPFEIVYFETELRLGDNTIYGLLLSEFQNTMHIFFNGISDHEEGWFQDSYMIPETERYKQHRPEEMERQPYSPYKQQILTLVCNLIDFITQPEVEIVVVERTKEQNAKRIEKGQAPIPPIHYVHVTGKLKIYLDNLEKQENLDFHYRHRFWVRGHWRTLRNENRYKSHTGTKIWIAPFIKGEGLLIENLYKIKENDHRKIQVQKQP